MITPKRRGQPQKYSSKTVHLSITLPKHLIEMVECWAAACRPKRKRSEIIVEILHRYIGEGHIPMFIPRGKKVRAMKNKP